MNADKKIEPAGMATASVEHSRIQTMPMESGWQRRHLEAFEAWRGRSKHESAVAAMVKGWLEYADAHRERFESTIGEDGVLGPEWAAIGRGLLGLLNGETGRFDCGTLDAIIANALAGEGFDRYEGRKS